MQRTNQKEFRVEKVIKRKGDKLYVKWKGYGNSFNKWIDKTGIKRKKKKFSIKDFFSKCDQICSFLWILSHLLWKSLLENFIFCALKSSGKRVKVELDLCNYATNQILKIQLVLIQQNLPKKVDLANLKFNVDKLHTDNWKM